MLGYVQYITDIIFVYKYGRQSYIDYFIAYDQIDSVLGIPHYRETRNCITRISSIFIFAGIILLIIDFSTWLVDLDWSLFNVYFIEKLPKQSMTLAIISTSAKMFSDTVALLCGFYHCEQNYRQTERIIRIMDLILMKKKITKETQETLKEFKSLIISRPIKFHALNFYRLNYATIVSMFSVIVTYTIILLQNL
ncbi:uncharacterized protein LOC124537535 [Vanessa cardui]|uniref:uncharacterized protein LOC124537535 n=1 Tax=Vanessa cardui TaxID=171605 RepID=UPI001F1340A8|nr:uncharacterized protein LOC124537535 [Vanessa cardui]